MAKIVRFHEIGGPEVLKIEEGPSRKPGKGEANLVRGILPGGQPWVIRALSAEVRADGRIHVDGRDLLIANGQSVFATLICGPLPNGPFTLHSTHAVALAAYGDFTIDDILSPAPSNSSDNPVLLIRSSTRDGLWLAAGIPLVIND
jgi:hypothetical protein